MKALKKSFLALTLVIFAFVTLCGFKSNEGFSLEVDESFAISSGEDVSAVSERLNLPASEIELYFKNEGLKFIAVSEDTLTQIKLSAFEDESSVGVDAKDLSEEQMLSLFSSLSGTVSVVRSGDRNYAKTQEVHKDSGGIYTATQYLTVANGKTWFLSCYNPGDKTSDEIEAVFNSLSFEAKDTRIDDINSQIDEYNTKKNWIIPFIVVMCAVLLVGGVELFFNLRKNR